MREHGKTTRWTSAGGVLLAMLLLVAPGKALASELIYQPVNPAFGGHPGNAGWLFDSAAIQNQHKDDGLDGGIGGAEPLTPAQEFAQTLQRRLLFAVSDQIVSELFTGTDDEGQFQVEGTTISYVRVGNTLELTIFDGENTTDIIIPAGF